MLATTFPIASFATTISPTHERAHVIGGEADAALRAKGSVRYGYV
jgi:hypothetical protein